MVDLSYCLTNLSSFDIPLLYYYTSPNTIIYCLFSGDMYLSFKTRSSRSFWRYLLPKCLPMSLAKDENPHPFTYILSLGSIEYLIFVMVKIFDY